MARGLMSPSLGGVYSPSLTVHGSRAVESIAATNDRSERESKCLTPTGSSDIHPGSFTRAHVPSWRRSGREQDDAALPVLA
jgi:hypothetical protein